MVLKNFSLFSLLARSLVQDAIKNDGPSRKILLQSKNILKCNILEAIKFIDKRNNPVEADEISVNAGKKLKNYSVTCLIKNYNNKSLKVPA